MTQPRAAIYARISSDKRKDEAGVDRQVEACQAHIAARGYDLDERHVYVDNDISAWSGKVRPAYKRMLDAVRRDEVDVVIVFHLSRLWRARRERIEAIELFTAHHVSIEATNGSGLDLASPMGRSMAVILGELDTLESDLKSERVKAALAQNAAQGRSHGREAYGWRREPDPDTGRHHDVVDEAEAAVVVEATRRIAEGDSIRSICRDFDERGVVTPADARREPEARKGSPWRPNVVRALVTRPRNAGLLVSHGEVVSSDAIPPIVDRDLYETACAVLRDPRRKTATSSAAKHLLSGIARCGVCGGPMRAADNRGRPSYRCAPKSCVSRSRPVVDDLVERVVLGRLSAPDAVDLLAPAVDPATRQAAAQVTQLRRRLDDAGELYAAGSIDATQLAAISADLRPRLAEAQARAARIDARPLLDDLVAVGADQAREVWDRLPIEKKRSVVAELIEIRVNRTAQGIRRFDPRSIEITWR